MAIIPYPPQTLHEWQSPIAGKFPEQDWQTSFSQIRESPSIYNGGFWVSTNEVYFSNPFDGPSLEHKLSQIASHGDTMVGVSGMFSLNLFAIRSNLRYLVMVDISEQVVDFWKAVEPIIVQSITRAEVINGIGAYLTKIHHIDAKLFLEREIEKGTSWLSEEYRFTRIQDLFKERRFIFKTIDLCDTQAVQDLNQALVDNRMIVDIVYLSNVQDWTSWGAQGGKQKGLVAYQENMDRLIPSTACVIMSYKLIYGGNCENLLLQGCFVKGSLPAKDFLIPAVEFLSNPMRIGFGPELTFERKGSAVVCAKDFEQLQKVQKDIFDYFLIAKSRERCGFVS